MLMYYAFTPNTVLKSVLPNGSEPTWQISMSYSDSISLIYVNESICMVICPSTRFKLIILWPRMNHLMPRLFQNASYVWGGLVPLWVLKHSFLSLTDCYWLYNTQLNTSRRVLFLPPSDSYVRSFLYLIDTLIKFYYTKLWVIQPYLWPQIEFFSSGGQESWHLCIPLQPFTLRPGSWDTREFLSTLNINWWQSRWRPLS